jgi:hypothetical protein
VQDSREDGRTQDHRHCTTLVAKAAYLGFWVGDREGEAMNAGAGLSIARFSMKVMPIAMILTFVFT